MLSDFLHESRLQAVARESYVTCHVVELLVSEVDCRLDLLNLKLSLFLLVFLALLGTATRTSHWSFLVDEVSDWATPQLVFDVCLFPLELDRLFVDAHDDVVDSLLQLVNLAKDFLLFHCLFKFFTSVNSTLYLFLKVVQFCFFFKLSACLLESYLFSAY